MSTTQKGVEAVERALQILECFSSDDRELSLADLARRTEQYKSTLLRMIVSLERFGYIVRTPDGRYRLGPTVLRLGAQYRDHLDLSNIVRPELDRLSAATNETASYFIREADSRVCLFRSEPARSIRHALRVGAPLPLDRGASGRVIRAFTGDVSAECRAVREAGFAVSRGERDPEVGAIAMPILSHHETLIGVISVSGLVTRFTPDDCERMLGELRRSQAHLLEQLRSA